MSWEAVKSAWNSDEPLIQGKIERIEKPYPWKAALIISFIAFLIFPASAFLSIPITLWMLFAVDVAVKPGQIKEKIGKSLLNEHAKTTRWLLDQPINAILQLNYAESLIVARRLDDLRNTFLGRIEALKSIPAEGELSDRISLRIETYENGLSGLIEPSAMVRGNILKFHSFITEMAESHEIKNNLEILNKVKQSYENLEKAHELGVASDAEVSAAREQFFNIRSTVLCSSTKCCLPKIHNSHYCSLHTCATSDCLNASGCAANHAGEHIQAQLFNAIAKKGAEILNNDEVNFNQSLHNMFCERCLYNAKTRMSKPHE